MAKRDDPGFGDYVGAIGRDVRALFASRRRVWSARRAKAVLAGVARPGERARIAGAVEPAPVGFAAATVTRSPFTLEPAVFWHARTRRRTFGFAKASGLTKEGTLVVEWHDEIRLSSRVPFILRDDAGEPVLVDPARTIVLLEPRDVSDHPAVSHDNPELLDLVRRHGQISEDDDDVTLGRIFSEASIRAGEHVAVYGVVSRRMVTAPAGYRGDALALTTLAGHAGEPLVILGG
jgi:hypothetical protein